MSLAAIASFVVLDRELIAEVTCFLKNMVYQSQIADIQRSENQEERIH